MGSVNAGPGSRWLSSRTRPREPLLADHTNEIKQALRGGRLAVEAPLELVDRFGGMALRLAARLVSTSIAKSGPAGIPPLSGSTPGSASDVTRHAFDGTTLTAGDPTTAYNLASSAVGANKWLILLTIAGYSFVIFEDC